MIHVLLKWALLGVDIRSTFRVQAVDIGRLDFLCRLMATVIQKYQYISSTTTSPKPIIEPSCWTLKLMICRCISSCKIFQGNIFRCYFQFQGVLQPRFNVAFGFHPTLPHRTKRNAHYRDMAAAFRAQPPEVEGWRRGIPWVPARSKIYHLWVGVYMPIMRNFL